MKQTQNASDAGSIPASSTKRTFMRLQGIYILVTVVIITLTIELLSKGANKIEMFF